MAGRVCSVSRITLACAAGLCVEERSERVAMDLLLHSSAAEFQQRRRQIDAEHELVKFCPGLDQGWITDEERDADRFFVGQAALDAQAMLAIEIAVIAREDDQRPIELARCAQRVENLADAFFGAIKSRSRLRI